MFDKLSIEINEKKVKIVYGNYKNNFFHIKKFYTLSNSYYESNRKKMINSLLKDEKISSKRVSFIFNNPNLICKSIQTPIKRERNIDSFMAYEWEKHIPKNKEYVTRYKILKKSPEGIKILWVSCPRKIIDEYRELCLNFNLKPHVLNVAADSIFKIFKEMNSHETIAFMRLEEDHLYLNIINNKYDLISKSINMQKSKSIVDMIGRLFKYFEQEYKSPVSKIAFVGDAFNNLKELNLPILNEIHGIEISNKLNILDNIEILGSIISR
ncbi:MAG: hypothetical protein N4A57_18060 [Anaeromicrobium sp.]|uniref:type IV pilus biogenesis protein PilM n=1 Tax=Anaeromicrobium sp. TaxID=1929132 RepID=UPI0025FBCB1B|nr:hypothetical protein [Anaeromicrobium sp.]MCT4596155.1 hypothetical protein [Anaeromicrobium sp.]